MKTSTGIINYHLKERIEGQNSKITLSGSTLRKQKKAAPNDPAFPSSNEIEVTT
jgi:hypothetical protein